MIKKILFLGLICLLLGCINETVPMKEELPKFDYYFSTCTGEDAFAFKQKVPSLKIVEKQASLSFKQANYCGSNYSAKLVPEGNTLKIMEINDAPIAKCMCVYNVNMTLLESELDGFEKIEIWLTNINALSKEPQKITEISLI